MAGKKHMLLGGAAVSMALAAIAALGLPARAQQAVDVAGCADLEGEALAACLEAEGEPASDAAEQVEPEPAELPSEQGVIAPEAAEAADPEANPEEPDAMEEAEDAFVPDAEADAEADGAAEPASDSAEQVEPGPAEPPSDEGVPAPDAAEAADPEATPDEPAAMEEAEAASEPDADADAEADVAVEPASDAAEEAEREPVEAPSDEAIPERAAEPEATVDEADLSQEAEAGAAQDEPEAVERAEDAPEAGAEAEERTPVVEPEQAEAPLEKADEVEAVEETAVPDEVDATEEAEALEEVEAVEPEDVLSEEELEAAQRESVEEAVQAALAAERQKSQAEQEAERDDRVRILGAAAAGLAAGAILPQIGAMLVGQQGDRVILQQEERLIVRRDETARFLQDGGSATVEDFAGGVSLVTVTRPDGSRVLSWRDASGQVVRRVRVMPDGREITLFDGLEAAAEPEIRVTELPPIRREDQRRAFLSGASAEELLRVLSSRPVSAVDDRFTLRQILANDRIRWLMPSLALDAVTFDTGSASLGAGEIEALSTMGRTLRELVENDPQEVFLVEGHTDAVGSDISNLALSDQRAETVATLLTAYYGVPPENLVVQGFGEQDLRVPTLAASRENRRVEVRRITPLLR